MVQLTAEGSERARSRDAKIDDTTRHPAEYPHVDPNPPGAFYALRMSSNRARTTQISVLYSTADLCHPDEAI